MQVDWVGELPDGLILSKIEIDPVQIEIIGGKRLLGKISTIYTEKVHLDNLKGTGTIWANLALTPAALKIAPGSKEKMRIDYVVDKRPN